MASAKSRKGRRRGEGPRLDIVAQQERRPFHHRALDQQRPDRDQAHQQQRARGQGEALLRLGCLGFVGDQPPREEHRGRREDRLQDQLLVQKADLRLGEGPADQRAADGAETPEGMAARHDPAAEHTFGLARLCIHRHLDRGDRQSADKKAEAEQDRVRGEAGADEAEQKPGAAPEDRGLQPQPLGHPPDREKAEHGPERQPEQAEGQRQHIEPERRLYVGNPRKPDGKAQRIQRKDHLQGKEARAFGGHGSDRFGLVAAWYPGQAPRVQCACKGRERRLVGCAGNSGRGGHGPTGQTGLDSHGCGGKLEHIKNKQSESSSMTPRRVLSLWFPRLAAERVIRAAPQLIGQPLVVVADRRGGLDLVSLSATAEGLGLRRGMALGDARAICPELVTRPADPPRDAAFLAALRRWAGRFSPWAAEEGEAGLVLDISGCAHLFGGEETLAARVAAEAAGLGLSLRLGLADTLGAAWAVARFAGAGTEPSHGGDAIDQEARATRSRAKKRKWERGGAPPLVPGARAEMASIVPPGETRHRIGALPVAALRLDEGEISLLNDLGLRRIADVAALPRAQLSRRVGVRILRRLDQALGRAARAGLAGAPGACVRGAPDLARTDRDGGGCAGRHRPAAGSALRPAGRRRARGRGACG